MIARRLSAAVIALLGFATFARGSAAQEWNSPHALELARRAIDRRSGQIAASTVAGYSAKATGYLTFLAQIGDTAIFPPAVVRQDQLAVLVYWQAPNFSKQVVVGKRDTLLTPADIGYYSDRYGIVQSNFPDRIRMGDGKDISDVPHPFAAGATDTYEYAIVDSLSITTATRSLDAYQVAFRPRDASQARAVGSAYIDVRTADIVRLELTFTRAAILDRRIEYLSVSLENAFVEDSVWVPRRQSLEVVRTGTWAKMNVRGIIRGRWDVCCYDITFKPAPGLFNGPPIVFSSPSVMKAYKFDGNILDSLPPSVAVVRPEDIQRVQAEAERLIATSFRERMQRAALSVPRISDLVRVNRAEGLALGGAGTLRPATALTLDGRVRYGFADAQWKGEAGVTMSFGGGRSLRLFASRDYADARDVPEVSLVRNSLAAQEFGSDYTDPYDVRAAGAQITFGRVAGIRWRVDVAHERHDSLRVRATPENGTYAALIPARHVDGTRVSVGAQGAAYRIAGGTLVANGEFRVLDVDTKAARVAADAEFTRPLAGGQLALRTIGAAISSGDVAPQFLVYFGGPTTAPGYEFRSFAARRGLSQRVEWRVNTPFPSIDLGRFGHMPGHATFAPYAQGVWVDSRSGAYPALGVALEPLLGLMRFDVARGLRDGRWTFSVDLARAYWPIM